MDELRAARDAALNSSKEAERKLKSLEAENMQLHEVNFPLSLHHVSVLSTSLYLACNLSSDLSSISVSPLVSASMVAYNRSLCRICLQLIAVRSRFSRREMKCMMNWPALTPRCK